MKILKDEERIVTKKSLLSISETIGQPYTCYICLETHTPPALCPDVNSFNGYDPFQLSVCGHVFCKSCFVPYLKSKIEEGDVYPTCFFPIENVVSDSAVNSSKYTPCGVHIPHIDIKECLKKDSKTLKKYHRYKYDKENPSARRCPDCDAPNSFKMISVKKSSMKCKVPKNPICFCENCDREFCYYHAGAHVGKTCAQYEKEIAGETDLNENYINTFAKKCPECGVLVQKLEGCNQMKCSVCNTNFCWLCLTIVDDGTFPVHFQWWNIRGCPNMQLNESIEPSKTELFLSKAMSVMQIVVVGVPSAILAVGTFLPLYCVFHSIGSSFQDRALNFFSLWGNILTVVLLLPVALLALVLSPLLCVFYATHGLIFGDDDESTSSTLSGEENT